MHPSRLLLAGTFALVGCGGGESTPDVTDRLTITQGIYGVAESSGTPFPGTGVAVFASLPFDGTATTDYVALAESDEAGFFELEAVGMDLVLVKGSISGSAITPSEPYYFVPTLAEGELVRVDFSFDDGGAWDPL